MYRHQGRQNPISIHALLAESDMGSFRSGRIRLYFYPRSPCGERRGSGVGRLLRVIFLSTLSLRRATRCQALDISARRISIHALLAESDLLLCPSFMPSQISIHALLAESDTWARGSRATYVISIHALLAESDVYITTTTICIAPFLSTLSLRRATCTLRQLKSALHHFYPRSPGGERRQVKQTCRAEISISIHALLAESDQRY